MLFCDTPRALFEDRNASGFQMVCARGWNVMFYEIVVIAELTCERLSY